ncbi:MAG: hypothetical protein AAGF31_06715 [Planctomycetota bacterium]
MGWIDRMIAELMVCLVGGGIDETWRRASKVLPSTLANGILPFAAFRGDFPADRPAA